MAQEEPIKSDSDWFNITKTSFFIIDSAKVSQDYTKTNCTREAPPQRLPVKAVKQLQSFKTTLRNPATYWTNLSDSPRKIVACSLLQHERETNLDHIYCVE